MFLPILFSTTHSYPPVSSCWKLGISSTALEYFILTLLGKGTPLALFQVISGTGLEETEEENLSRDSDSSIFQDCHSGCRCNNPTATKYLIELKSLFTFFFLHADEWFGVNPIWTEEKLSHNAFRPIMSWRHIVRNIIATVTLGYRNPEVWNERQQEIENMLQGIQLTSRGRNTPA